MDRGSPNSALTMELTVSRSRDCLSCLCPARIVSVIMVTPPVFFMFIVFSAFLAYA